MKIKKTPVTLGFLGICLVVFILCAIQSLSLGDATGSAGLAQLLWLAPDLPAYSQVYRGLTFSFVHAGAHHLIMNGLFILFFGTAIERRYGSLTMAAILVATSYSSALIIDLFSGPGSVTVGASGVGYGLMAVAAGMMARSRWQRGPILILIAIQLGYTLITPGVSWWGHVGGLVGGAALSMSQMLVEGITGVHHRAQKGAAKTLAAGTTMTMASFTSLGVIPTAALEQPTSRARTQLVKPLTVIFSWGTALALIAAFAALN